MSLLRRRMMMQTMESGAKYPLVNGRHEFSDGSYVEISNGNHVYISKNVNGGAYINISNIFQNGIDAAHDTNINEKPTMYIVPSGKPAEFYIKNVKGVGLYDGQTNFRISEERVSGSFKTGTFNTSNPEFNTTVKKTLSDPEDVGCLFVYSTMPKGASIEFDVEFYVNGERWI